MYTVQNTFTMASLFRLFSPPWNRACSHRQAPTLTPLLWSLTPSVLRVYNLNRTTARPNPTDVQHAELA